MGGVQYRVGDQIIYNGQAWEHVDNTESVTSVAGRVGDVVLTRHDIHGLGALASADSVDYGSQVRNKPDSAPRVHAHSFAEITGKPAAYPPAPHRHAWGDIDGKPATSTRWPRLTEVEGLQAELDKRPRQIKTVDDISQRLDSGYYQTSQPGPGWPAGAQGWWHLLSVTHGNPSNYYALQIASSHSWSAADYYIRCTANNGNAAWDKLWHSRNFDPDTKLNVSSYHWDNLPGKPPLAAQGHTHTIANVTGLQDALNARLNAQLFHWAHLPGKPDLAAASHRHPMHSIDGLTAELASRFKCHDSGASGYLPPNANHVGSATGSMRSGSVDTPTSDWTQIFSTITADTRFGFQIASPWHTEDLYHRHLVAGQFRSWRRIWDAGNFDPASKLDASSFRWDSLPGKPDLAAASHQHTVASIQGLQPALDGKHPNRAMLRGYCHVPNGGWNNAAENGWYHGPDMANAPLGGWLMGQVIAHNALWVRQDVYPFTSGSAHTRYVRYKHNGSWAPWHKIRDSAHRVFTGAQMPTSGVEDGDIWIVP
ncbi:MAG: hypothetical protein Q4B94_00240 [Pseudomonadota bacterium]|nr:hypothetical protein [Pseudomonadota bacterium]